MYSLEFRIEGLPKILSNGSHGHWAKAHGEKKKWRKLVAQAIGANLPKLPLKVAACEFLRASSVEPDSDNLCISFKSCRDALVEWGVIENDKPSNMPGVRYLWQKAKPGKGFIKISVREINTEVSA